MMDKGKEEKIDKGKEEKIDKGKEEKIDKGKEEKIEPDGYLRENPMLRVMLTTTYATISSQITTIQSTTDEQIKSLQTMRDQLTDQVDASVLQKFDLLISDLNKSSAEKILLLKKELSNSQRDIFRDVAIDRLLERIFQPSRDIEFGMAMILLIHTDPAFKQYISDDPRSSIRDYILNKFKDVNTISPLLFEEQLIVAARALLFGTLSRSVRESAKVDSPVISGHMMILPKYDRPLRLVDSSIHHSHEVMLDPDMPKSEAPKPSPSTDMFEVEEWKDLLGYDVPKLPTKKENKEDDADLELFNFDGFDGFDGFDDFERSDDNLEYDWS